MILDLEFIEAKEKSDFYDDQIFSSIFNSPISIINFT